MNDIEYLKRLMSDYKQTTNTLFNMLDNYLETPQKPSESVLNDETKNNTKN